MSAFAAWLMGFARTWLTWLYNNFVDFVNAGIEAFCSFILAVLSLFPAGPTLPTAYNGVPDATVLNVFLNTLNWLFPVQYFVALFGFVILAIIAYVVVAPLARWLKLLT